MVGEHFHVAALRNHSSKITTKLRGRSQIVSRVTGPFFDQNLPHPLPPPLSHMFQPLLHCVLGSVTLIFCLKFNPSLSLSHLSSCHAWHNLWTAPYANSAPATWTPPFLQFARVCGLAHSLRHPSENLPSSKNKIFQTFGSCSVFPSAICILDSSSASRGNRIAVFSERIRYQQIRNYQNRIIASKNCSVVCKCRF